MNARQKAKKLKKELEALKLEKPVYGDLWLRIDGYQVEEEFPEQDLYSDKVYLPRNTYTIIVGSMRAKLHPMSKEDRLIIINSDILDKKVQGRKRG